MYSYKFLLIINLLLVFSIYTHAQDWADVGGFTPENALPEKIIEFEGDLIVLGEFSSVNGEDLGHIVRWNGSEWTTMGGNIEGDFKCVGVANGELYVGGIIVEDGQSNQQAVYKWNGTTWIGTGNATDIGYPYAMTEWNDQLIVAARGSGAANAIHRFEGGTSWTQLGTEIADISMFNQDVNALAVYNDSLFIAGDFDNVGAQADAQRIAKLSGNNWVSVNFPMPMPEEPEVNNGEVEALEVHDGKLYAGGSFFGYDDVESETPSIVSYDGNSWTPHFIDIESNNPIIAMKSDGDYLFIGGDIGYLDGDDLVTGVIAFDSTADEFLQMNFYQPGAPFPSIRDLSVVGGELYASGQFLAAGSSEEQMWGLTRFIGDLSLINSLAEIDSENLILESYPNPFIDQLTISFTLQKSEDLTIRISSIQGRVMIEKSLLGNNGLNHVQLELDELSTGIYMLDVFKNNPIGGKARIASKKLIKN